VYGGMDITETELIFWEVCVNDWVEAFEYEFFKYFGEEWSDWSVRARRVSGFSGFEYHNYDREFPKQRKVRESEPGFFGQLGGDF